MASGSGTLVLHMRPGRGHMIQEFYTCDGCHSLIATDRNPCPIQLWHLTAQRKTDLVYYQFDVHVYSACQHDRVYQTVKEQGAEIVIAEQKIPVCPCCPVIIALKGEGMTPYSQDSTAKTIHEFHPRPGYGEFQRVFPFLFEKNPDRTTPVIMKCKVSSFVEDQETEYMLQLRGTPDPSNRSSPGHSFEVKGTTAIGIQNNYNKLRRCNTYPRLPSYESDWQHGSQPEDQVSGSTEFSSLSSDSSQRSISEVRNNMSAKLVRDAEASDGIAVMGNKPLDEPSEEHYTEQKSTGGSVATEKPSSADVPASTMLPESSQHATDHDILNSTDCLTIDDAVDLVPSNGSVPSQHSDGMAQGQGSADESPVTSDSNFEKNEADDTYSLTIVDLAKAEDNTLISHIDWHTVLSAAKVNENEGLPECLDNVQTGDRAAGLRSERISSAENEVETTDAEKVADTGVNGIMEGSWICPEKDVLMSDCPAED